MLRKVYHDFISILFPELCAGCGEDILREEGCICTNCRIALPLSNQYLDPQNTLFMRFKGRIDLKWAFSYLKYTKKGIVFELLQNLKYQGNSEIAVTLGKIFGNELAANGYREAFDLLVPVPLHHSRQQKRGYNQSEVFAQGLTEFLKAEISAGVVIRTKATQTQTKFAGSKRWDNVQNIFTVTVPEQIRNKKVALVDDVVTTGATLESLANEVLKYEPAELSILTLAEADKY